MALRDSALVRRPTQASRRVLAQRQLVQAQAVKQASDVQATAGVITELETAVGGDLTAFAETLTEVGLELVEIDERLDELETP